MAIQIDASVGIDDFLEIVHKRRSCRRYLAEPVPEEMIDKILEAGRWSPSGCSSEPWEFIVVRDATTLRKHSELYTDLRALSEQVDTGPDGFPFPDMDYLDNVTVLIVVCGDRRLGRAYPELYYRSEIFHQSIGACIENMFLAAAVQGLGGTWLSMGKKLEPPLAELFGVPDGYRIETVFAVGWPDLKRELRERRPLGEIVHYEHFDPARARGADQIAAAVRAIRNRRREDRALSGEISDGSRRLQEERA